MNKCFLWIKHKIIHKQGHGYKCKHCGRTKAQCYGQ